MAVGLRFNACYYPYSRRRHCLPRPMRDTAYGGFIDLNPGHNNEWPPDRGANSLAILPAVLGSTRNLTNVGAVKIFRAASGDRAARNLALNGCAPSAR